MSVDHRPIDPATLADSEGAAGEQDRALATRLVAVLECPALISPSDLGRCERLLRTAGLSNEAYDQALSLLAAIVYWRPDLVGVGAVAALEALFARDPLPDVIQRQAAEMLSLLLTTPAAPEAVSLLFNLLARPGLPDSRYSSLLGSLAYASCWAMPRLELEALVGLAEHEHLSGWQGQLLETAIEPALFASPASVGVSVLERLVRLFEGYAALKYISYYIADTISTPAIVRSVLGAFSARLFDCHEVIHHGLMTGRRQVLMIQNIADGQGDEIIRTVPLLDALLRCNPLLEVVLVTAREYLYAHSRITPVSIDDQATVRSILRLRFDAVVDFYEPNVPGLNYDPGLEQEVQAHLQAQPPFLYLASQKGWNRFVFERVDLQGRAFARALGLDRQRVPNVYETTLRLIAELGLPLRLGEEPPDADSVLAGLPCGEAEAAWSTLLRQNRQGRPVALVCPFGGAEPLKGYVERQDDALAAQLRGLVAEGFYLVLLPNGRPWGSASRAGEVVRGLEQSEQEQIVVAPDPAAGSGVVTYAHAGTHTVPFASYQMRLVTYFVRFADLMVTVEGWMVHTAYWLGKRYRVLMLAYSHGSEWHPYGRTLQQEVVLPAAAPARVPAAEQAAAPPLPEQPRKFALLYVLRGLGRSGEARAVLLLRWALRSEDRDVRLAATESLGRCSGPDVDATLRALLGDPANRVRAAAAGALLRRAADSPASLDGLRPEQLRAHHWIGQEPRDWTRVLQLAESARSALQVALQDDDPVVRREAAQYVQLLDRRDFSTSATRPVVANPDVKAALRELFRAGRRGSDRLVGSLHGLSHRLAQRRAARGGRPTVLILTPVKDAAACLDGYCRQLRRLTYPHALISLGLLESDSADATFQDLQRRLPALRAQFRRVGLWKKDFGYRIPAGVPRWEPVIQVERRRVLAKSRNQLLFRALDDEAWVLWLDVDVVEYPPDLIERLLATGKDIVQPHCVLDYGGPTFDTNGWRDQGRLHLDDLRGEGELVELDAVGATVLWVRADVHREGLIYPPFLYGTANPRVRIGSRRDFEGQLDGEIETEGLGIMAHDMGYRCWGMPRFEVIHRRA